jgi:pimeloyl-ACP methyl ester carboxylesterase
MIIRYLTPLVAALTIMVTAAEARPPVEYISFGRANGALYRPDGAPRAAFVMIHRTANFMRHITCGELASRGYLVLCMNPGSANNEAIVDVEDLLLDVKSGVAFLRKQTGIEKIILFGHSGGGPIMSTYQAVAEKGLAYCRSPEKILPCSDKVADLPRADGVVLADAHLGSGVMSMRNLNPALALGADGAITVKPEFDLLNPANGFNATAPQYPEAFVQRYVEAQARMMAELTKDAQTRQAAIQTGGPRALHDDLVLVPSNGVGMVLRLEPNAMGQATTARPQDLLKNDGTISRQIVKSVAVPETAPGPLTTNAWSLKTFLSAHAVRAENSLDGFDYCSSNNTTVCAVESVSAPILVAAMGGYNFVRDGETLYDRAAAKDKAFVVVEGALHGFTPCTECEKTPGQYGNATKNFFDYVRAWTDKRL